MRKPGAPRRQRGEAACVCAGARRPHPGPSCPLSLSMTNNDGYSCQAWRLLGGRPPPASSSLAVSPLPALCAHPLAGQPSRARTGRQAVCRARGRLYSQSNAHRGAGGEQGHEAERGPLRRGHGSWGWNTGDRGAAGAEVPRWVCSAPARGAGSSDAPRGRGSSLSLPRDATGALRPPEAAPVLEGPLGLLRGEQTWWRGGRGAGTQVKVLTPGR